MFFSLNFSKCYLNAYIGHMTKALKMQTSGDGEPGVFDVMVYLVAI